MPPIPPRLDPATHDSLDLLEAHDGYSEIRPRRRVVVTPVAQALGPTGRVAQ